MDTLVLCLVYTLQYSQQYSEPSVFQDIMYCHCYATAYLHKPMMSSIQLAGHIPIQQNTQQTAAQMDTYILRVHIWTGVCPRFEVTSLAIFSLYQDSRACTTNQHPAMLTRGRVTTLFLASRALGVLSSDRRIRRAGDMPVLCFHWLP